ncbi:hypothetical protein GYMLUDRAFT_465987 [Collybiopsis luxurians FD-317 M1]|uniref:Uncharacterized protein n=1 Tax=Collybiopsis luxurians FD-317 M1 TaxID=944289 RepID=A0A0D0CKC2_9AGAR|nr:hypothetical protein GYMLUDRAFT_465987 [Collybiopsis luxurians FD-317 M1]
MTNQCRGREPNSLDQWNSIYLEYRKKRSTACTILDLFFSCRLHRPTRSIFLTGKILGSYLCACPRFGFGFMSLFCFFLFRFWNETKRNETKRG